MPKQIRNQLDPELPRRVAEYQEGKLLREKIKQGKVKPNAEIVAFLLALTPPWSDTGLGDSVCFFCGLLELENKHEPDCVWQLARNLGIGGAQCSVCSGRSLHSGNCTHCGNTGQEPPQQ